MEPGRSLVLRRATNSGAALVVAIISLAVLAWAVPVMNVETAQAPLTTSDQIPVGIAVPTHASGICSDANTCSTSAISPTYGSTLLVFVYTSNAGAGIIGYIYGQTINYAAWISDNQTGSNEGQETIFFAENVTVGSTWATATTTYGYLGTIFVEIVDVTGSSGVQNQPATWWQGCSGQSLVAISTYTFTCHSSGYPGGQAAKTIDEAAFFDFALKGVNTIGTYIYGTNQYEVSYQQNSSNTRAQEVDYEVLPSAGNYVGYLNTTQKCYFAAGGVLLYSAFRTITHPAQHVVVIYLENQNLTRIWGLGPSSFEDHLSAVYGNLTGFYAVCHGSQPNYLAQWTASTESQCGQQPLALYANQSLGDLLTAGATANGEHYAFTYDNAAESIQDEAHGSLNGSQVVCEKQEGVSGTGFRDQMGSFDIFHVPLAYSANVTGHSISGMPACAGSHIVNSNQFNASVSTAGMDNYTFYSPNVFDDGHNSSVTGKECGGTKANYTGCAKQADAWLKAFLQPFINSAVNGTGGVGTEHYNMEHTVFIVAYDESDGPGKNVNNKGYEVLNSVPGTNNTAYCNAGGSGNGGVKGNTVCGGMVWAAVVAPGYSAGSQTVATDFAPFSIASTVEILFGLSPLGERGAYDSTADRSAVPGFPALMGFLNLPGGTNGY